MAAKRLGQLAFWVGLAHGPTLTGTTSAITSRLFHPVHHCSRFSAGILVMSQDKPIYCSGEVSGLDTQPPDKL